MNLQALAAQLREQTGCTEIESYRRAAVAMGVDPEKALREAGLSTDTDDDGEGTGNGPTIIGNRSDDPKVRILRALDRVEERMQSELASVRTKLSTFESAWDSARQRLERLEDAYSQGRGPAGFHLTGASASEERDARRVVGEWVGRCHMLAYDQDYQQSERGAQFRANQVEDTNGDGGFLIPSPLMPEVIRIVQTFGVAREICRVVPMTSKTLDLSNKNAGPSVSWPGEATAPTATKATFTRSTLTAKKLVALDEISMEVEEDSAVELGMYLLELFGEAVAQEEDKQAFTQSANPFTGVLETAGIGSVTLASVSFDSVTYDDLVDVLNAVNSHVVRNGRWLLSTYALNTIRKIKDTQGNPIWGPMAANQPATLMGRPYSISEVMPGTDNDGTASKPVLAYGDFRYSFIGQRSAFNVAFSSDAGFKEATRWMRVLERVAFVTPLPGAFGKLVTAAS